MLCGAPQCGFTALLDLVADLAGIDVGDRAGEIDARAPSRERRQQRQLSQVTAIALSSGAGELTALLGRGLGNPTGDGEACSEPLHIPLERSRQWLIEIVDIEDRDPFRTCITAEIREMTVSAGLDAETGRRARGEIGSHDGRRTT